MLSIEQKMEGFAMTGTGTNILIGSMLVVLIVGIIVETIRQLIGLRRATKHMKVKRG